MHPLAMICKIKEIGRNSNDEVSIGIVDWTTSMAGLLGRRVKMSLQVETTRRVSTMQLGRKKCAYLSVDPHTALLQLVDFDRVKYWFGNSDDGGGKCE
jgi:hypothetical protein